MENRKKNRLTKKEYTKLRKAIESGLTNEQLYLMFPGLTINNIKGLRRKVRIERNATSVGQIPVVSNLPRVTAPVQQSVSYTFNGIDVQLSKAPKSVTIQDNSLTLVF